MEKIRGTAGEFTRDQQQEIQKGLARGLDVSIYAKPQFLSVQMREIRLGLREHLPVDLYASADFDWLQMHEIRKGLQHGVEVKKYLDATIPFDVMRQIRYGLERGTDLSSKKHLPAGVLKELRKSMETGVDLRNYIAQDYEEEQLHQIRLALEQKLDIAPYLSPLHRGAALREIRKGLEDHIDVSLYAGTERNWQQMREIRIGLEQRLDVTAYIHPFYSWQQMREIRLGLLDELPVEIYSSLMYTPKEMKKRRLELKKSQEVQPGEEVRTEERDFSLMIAEDGMEAVMLLHQPGKKMSKEKLMASLKKSGVVKGLDEAAIDAVCQGKTAGDLVVVARGREPEKGIDGWYEFFFETEIRRAPKLMENGAVDYQNIKWFEIVQKGQKVACYHPAKNGKTGYRVTGEMLFSYKGKELKPLGGSGFDLLPDGITYLAQTDGRITYEDGKLEITNVLIVNEVTLATGNIEFNGSIYVKGTVGEGVIVRAGRDILVEGFIEAATLDAGGDIILRKGCNAAGGGMLSAGRDVMGKFFENANVRAGADIHANYCLNSHLEAQGIIEIAGHEGMLAGGDSYGAMGITSYQVGNEVGIATRLRVGHRDSLAIKEARLNEREQMVHKELVLLKNAYMDFNRKYSSEERNSNPMYLKLEDAIYTKELESGKLVAKREKLDKEKKTLEKAKVTVGGTMYPGVVVEINNQIWEAKRREHHVTVRRNNGRIETYSNF